MQSVQLCCIAYQQLGNSERTAVVQCTGAVESHLAAIRLASRDLLVVPLHASNRLICHALLVLWLTCSEQSACQRNA